MSDEQDDAEAAAASEQADNDQAAWELAEERRASEKIEPALSAEEWKDALDPEVREALAYETCYLWGRERPHGAIAIANAALPDDDPRKITRRRIALIRDAADELASEAGLDDPRAAATLRAFADALESYLPPA